MNLVKQYLAVILAFAILGGMTLVYGRDFLVHFGALEIATIVIPAALLALIRLLYYPRMSREMKFVVMAAAFYTAIALTIFAFLTLFTGSPWGYIAGGLYFGYEAIPIVAFYLTARGQHDRALRYVNGVMRLFRGSGRLYAVRGLVRSYLKDDYGAAEDYGEAITHLKARKSPRDRTSLARYYAGRLEALMKLRDYDRALDDANAVIRMQPDGAYGYAQRALTLLHLGDYDDALDDVEHALKLNKEPTWSGTLYNTRGLAKYALSEHDAAMADYAKALETPVSPDMVKLLHPIVLGNQGIVHYLKGDYAAAMACFSRARDIDPESLQAMAGLAITRYAMGDQAAGLEDWRSLAAKEPQFMDSAWVQERYYKWTPTMVDMAQNIITTVQAAQA